MRLSKKSTLSQGIAAVLLFIFMFIVASQLMKVDLTTIIFSGVNQPATSQQVETKFLRQKESPVEQIYPPSDLSGFEHYTDKNGNDVIIVPARHEAKAEPVPIQTPAQQSLPQVSPLPSQKVSPGAAVPVQAAPPTNLTLVARRAANARSGMNIFESCRCNNGLATKGDSTGDVLEKCAQPAIRQSGTNSDCQEIWLYNFGPNEFMQGVCFEGGRVSKVLSLDYGY